jgi:hypothetical protein
VAVDSKAKAGDQKVINIKFALIACDCLIQFSV